MLHILELNTTQRKLCEVIICTSLSFRIKRVRIEKRIELCQSIWRHGTAWIWGRMSKHEGIIDICFDGRIIWGEYWTMWVNKSLNDRACGLATIYDHNGKDCTVNYKCSEFMNCSDFIHQQKNGSVNEFKMPFQNLYSMNIKKNQ